MSFTDALKGMAEAEGIDVVELLNALAEAMLKAYKKRPDAAEDAEIEINPETGDIKVIGLVLDADGNIVDEWDATPADFGRIAAREARNNLLNAIADIRRGLLDSPVRIDARGGQLSIAWDGEGQPVYLTGPAVTVFESEIELPGNP